MKQAAWPTAARMSESGQKENACSALLASWHSLRMYVRLLCACGMSACTHAMPWAGTGVNWALGLLHHHRATHAAGMQLVAWA